ncbi:hydroxyphenylacetyl-CoA thioesterase PaaI [Faecalibacter bovis]|uniref:Hydroxyphenylacetyl-CoA thioesterase PaaI n=1 Tax=Faecalibacter bovis TaxID=2898187 RepID=A0ABX7XCD5_9FLAO|nr:hydroxyphenylacetyl-CoA thioesterase PaaI [Faecalibacter bovis]MBS7334400.1 hydroxyphenylacetyl-CoA thioesterase PaaI [Weeksellaceae bacterium]QTV05484.1 hydroxyphenylacetyl-CoA thioesterase PaaI [Faecalibacter bovis]
MEAQRLLSAMTEHDNFSKWLGLEVLEVKEGYSKLQATIRPEMMNGFGIVHGGVTFSMADSAFAFSCNMYNNISVALDVHISFTKPGKLGDVLTIESKEISTTRKTGIYDITITNQNNELIALFKGTCFRTGKPLIEE